MRNARVQSRTTAAIQVTELTSGGVVTTAATHHLTQRASPYPSQTKEPRQHFL
jgi:hypothetical protein